MHSRIISDDEEGKNYIVNYNSDYSGKIKIRIPIDDCIPETTAPGVYPGDYMDVSIPYSIIRQLVDNKVSRDIINMIEAQYLINSKGRQVGR